MPLLEKLVLLEIYDYSLRYLWDFQRCIRFLFRFPGQLEVDWKNIELLNIESSLEQEDAKNAMLWYRKRLLPEK